MVSKYFSTFFETFQNMSQKCEQFPYGTFGGIILGFWSPYVPERTSKQQIKKIWLVDCFLMPKWETWNVQKQVFALHVLQIKRFRRSGKFIENEDPNCITKASKLKPLASKVWIFEILMDFGKLVFFMSFGLPQMRANKSNKSDFGRAEIEESVKIGPCHHQGWTTKLRFWLF